MPEQSVRDAALVQALYYQTLAHVNGGRLGDPMHLYLSRGMEVRKASARGTTLAQSLAQAVHVPADTEVTINNVTPRFSSYEDGQAWLLSDEGKAALKGSVTNVHSGEKLEITAGNVGHAVNAHAKGRRRDVARLEAIAAWHELLTDAIPDGPHDPREVDAHKLEGIHDYYAAMRIDGSMYLVRVVVQQFKEGKVDLNAISVHRVYDTKTQSLPVMQAHLADEPLTQTRPGEGSTIKVGDLLAGVKGRDGFELMQQSAGRRLGYDATQTKEAMDVIEKIGNGENVPGVSAEQHAEITRLVDDARRQGHLPAEGDGEPGADGTTGSAAEPGADTGLEQKRRGEIFVPGAYRNNLRSIVRMMQTSNASTLMHEMSHDWLHWLMHDAQQEGSPQQVKDDAALLMKWLHVKGAVLPDANGAFSPTNKRAHEQFATGFEQYLREGRAPSRALEGVFSRFKDWLTTIYKTVRDMGQFAVPINDDVRGVFDRLLSYDGHEPAVIEPKDHRAATIHDIHEADAQAHPSVAHETAEAIRREADAVAAEHDQEVHDEITNRGGTEGAADGQPVAGKEAGGNEPTGEPAREGVAASSAVEVGKGGTGASGEGAKPSPEPVKPAPAPVSAKVEAAEPKPEPEPAQSPATRAKPVEPVAVPEAPNAPFKEEPRFLDKAGNVRLDNVQSSEDFKELAREWAQEHGDEQMVRLNSRLPITFVRSGGTRTR